MQGTDDFTTLATKFEQSHNGRPMTALTAYATVRLDHALAPHADAMERALDSFLKIVPPSKLTWYSTDSSSKDKPCTARALAIPRSWFRPGSPRRVHRSLSVHDGEAYNSVPHCGLRIVSWDSEPNEERPWEPSLVRFMLPATDVRTDPAPLFGLAKQLADEFPFVSGHAGYCVERNLEYYDQASLRTAYPLAMRFQGTDLDDRVWDFEFTHLKTVNWLTLIGDNMLDQIGGRGAIRARVHGPQVIVHDAKHGLILQAGETPELGDVNRGEWLPAYRAAYQAVENLFAPAFTPDLKLTIPEDRQVNEEKTDAWYRRFAREVADTPRDS